MKNAHAPLETDFLETKNRKFKKSKPNLITVKRYISLDNNFFKINYIVILMLRSCFIRIYQPTCWGNCLHRLTEAERHISTKPRRQTYCVTTSQIVAVHRQLTATKSASSATDSRFIQARNIKHIVTKGGNSGINILVSFGKNDNVRCD